MNLPRSTKSFALASAALFALHLPVFLFVEGEFTDGVLQVAYFDAPTYWVAEGAPPARYVPPLFPALLSGLSSITWIEPLLSGRLISLVAYCVTGLGVALFLVRLMNRSEDAAWVAWIGWGFWGLAPMANRWAFHAMSDMTFCCLSAWAVGCLVLASRQGQSEGNRMWLMGNVLGWAAAWTRYQGFALMAVALVSALFLITGSRKRPGAGLWVAGIVAAIGWGGSLWALREGMQIHSDQFADRSVYAAEVYTDFALAALQFLPYAVTPPLLVLGLYGFLKQAKRGVRTRVWLAVGVIGALAGLYTQTKFLSFQFRYGLPLVPCLCVLAAIGWGALPGWPRWIGGTITGLWLALFTCLILVFQHETFGDLYRVATSIPGHAQGEQKVWASEVYNETYRNVKVSVWADRRVEWLDEKSAAEVAEGDLLVDSNVYPIPDDIKASLRERFRLRVEEESESQTIPLFPGELLRVPVAVGGRETSIVATSQPELMAFRYVRQYYGTVLYRIMAREDTPERTTTHPQ